MLCMESHHAEERLMMLGLQAAVVKHLWQGKQSKLSVLQMQTHKHQNVKFVSNTGQVHGQKRTTCVQG